MMCETSEKKVEYVVKLWASPEMFLGKHNLAREIYGSILARYFEINTPEIGLIDISPEFYKSQPADKALVLKESVGLNFGSENQKGAVSYTSSFKLSSAARVFCFDMFIGNPDRRIIKPNIFHSSNGYIVYDHEQAFPFSRPNTILGGLSPSWEYIKDGWHKEHIFYSDLRRNDCSLEIESFISAIDSLPDDLLDKIEENILDGWLTKIEAKHIRDYLDNTREHSHLFKRSLQEILA